MTPPTCNPSGNEVICVEDKPKSPPTFNPAGNEVNFVQPSKFKSPLTSKPSGNEVIFELFKFKYFIVYDEPTKIYEIKKI